MSAITAKPLRSGKVEHHDIGLFGIEHRERVGRVFGHHGAVPHRAEARPQKPQDRRLVVDHEHSEGVSHAARNLPMSQAAARRKPNA
jgi:hypothetical protein